MKMNIYQSSAAAESEPISKSYRASAFADALPELAAPGATPERLAHLEEHGFVIITDFVGNPLIPILRNGATIHTGHTVGDRERNTLSIGWSKWSGAFDGERKVADVRNAWQLSPAVRGALPHEWMKTAWDRWAETQKLGDALEDRYPGFDIQHIKAGEVVGWRGELEQKAASAGEAFKPWQTAV